MTHNKRSGYGTHGDGSGSGFGLEQGCFSGDHGQAEGDFRLDLGRSFVVGDHPHDVELARNAGATGMYVLSGHGRKHWGEVPGYAIVVEGIGEAVEEILERARHGQG